MIRLSIGKQEDFYMSKGNEILNYLMDHHRSKEKAVSAVELSSMFNTTKRGIRSAVTELRKSGYPICSGNEGYWYSTEPDDLQATISRLEAQVDNMIRAVRGLKQAKNRR